MITPNLVKERTEQIETTKSEKQKHVTRPKEDKRVDKGSLNGLRGLFSFHVLAYHGCSFFAGPVRPIVDLFAEIDMPLFFLLSGFSLALGYGRTKWNGSTRGWFGKSADGVDPENPEQEKKFFNSWEFYKKRFVRILPLHYLGIILVIVVWYYGVWPINPNVSSNDNMWAGVVISVFAINSWLLPYVNWEPNDPAWTISTLAFWYWIFPFIFPRLQRKNDKEIAHDIVNYFWLSVGINILLCVFLGLFGIATWDGDNEQIVTTMWMVTAHPVIRLPIFLMGVLAGLQVLKAHSDWENFEDPNLNKNILHSLIPWGCGKSIGGSKKEEQERLITPAKVDKDRATKIWRQRVDFSAFLYVVLLTTLCCIKVALDIIYDDDTDYDDIYSGEQDPALNTYAKFFFQNTGFWAFFLTTTLVHLQLTIIMGLCMDGGESVVSRFLRTKMLQFLGRISLSIYLIQWPMMGFIVLLINGPQSYSTTEELWAAFSNGDIIVPPGSPALLIVICPIVAFIVTKYFEEPIYKLLSGTR